MKKNLERVFKTHPGPVAKNATLSHPAGNGKPWPRETNAILCQLSYEGRWQEHGHEFSTYMMVMPIKMNGTEDAAASVAQLVEQCTTFAKSRVRFPARLLIVAFSQHVPVGS